jgi:hypothetical protein
MHGQQSIKKLSLHLRMGIPCCVCSTGFPNRIHKRFNRATYSVSYFSLDLITTIIIIIIIIIIICDTNCYPLFHLLNDSCLKPTSQSAVFKPVRSEVHANANSQNATLFVTRQCDSLTVWVMSDMLKVPQACVPLQDIS